MTDTKGYPAGTRQGPADRRGAEWVPPGVVSSFLRGPGRFYRECVAELRKVVWPTRREVSTYFAVVLVFVLVLVGIVTGLDFVFGKGVLAIFG